jgi:hypothetical protein
MSGSPAESFLRQMRRVVVQANQRFGDGEQETKLEV